MSGELAKLVIKSYDKPEEMDQQSKAKGEFVAMFNPEGFSITTEYVFDDKQADGETGSAQKPKSIAPREFNFDLLLDGTGASGIKKNVQEEIERFKKITGFESKERRQSFLTVSWGIFTIRCVLKKMEIKYTLFRNDGFPLRVILSLVLGEYKTAIQQLRENPPGVAKITKLANLSSGDTLEQLANKTYGDSSQIAELAKENGLSSLKSATSGERLTLPSKEELKKKAAAQGSNLINQGQSAAQQGISNLF